MSVNKLAIGTVQMGLEYGINNHKGQISRIESFEILHAAYDAGIDTLDTAEAYGNAHELIGDFHRAHPASSFKVITKYAASIPSDEFELRLQRYLNQLAIPKLDTLMFHSYANFRDNQPSITALQKAKEKGLFQSLGVSVYTNEELADLIQNEFVDVIQVPFNLLDNFSQKGELLLLAKQKNKTIHARSAFLQGLFFLDRSSAYTIAQALKSELKSIDRLAEAYQVSVEALALHYCLSQSTIDKVIIGVDSLAQLHKNILACQVSIDSEAIRQIDEIQVRDNTLLNPAKWPAKSY